MKICFKCNTLFKRHFNIGFEKACPVKDCFGEVVEIDDNIFYPVRTLNEKGYITASCCAGDLMGSSPYIIFDRKVNADCFLSYPTNFVQDEFESLVEIRRLIMTIEVLERQKELNEATYNLLEWAEKLPVAKDFFVFFIDVKPIDDQQFIEMIESILNLTFDSKSLDGTDDAYYSFQTILSPCKVASLSKKINALAKSNGWRVYIETSDYESPKKDMKIY